MIFMEVLFCVFSGGRGVLFLVGDFVWFFLGIREGGVGWGLSLFFFFFSDRL